MARKTEGDTLACDWCGHVVAVSRLVRFDAGEGRFQYACPSCSIKIDPHTLRIGKRPSQPPR